MNYGDTVEIDVEATSCNSSGGSCTYRLDLSDDTTGADLGMTVNTGVTFNEVWGGMFEKANISGCDQTFANGHLAFRNQQVDEWTSANTYVPVNPEYSKHLLDQECGMNTTNYASGTGGDITWTP